LIPQLKRYGIGGTTTIPVAAVAGRILIATTTTPPRATLFGNTASATSRRRQGPAGVVDSMDLLELDFIIIMLWADDCDVNRNK
jgi:hypothetical protein